MATSNPAPQSKRPQLAADDAAADADSLDSAIGPFFDTAGLSAWLGVSKQGIYRPKRRRVILGIMTLDRHLLFAAFQWSETKKPLPALPEVLALLDPANNDPVGSALWLNAPAGRFAGATPAELLRRGDREAVLNVARQIAVAWQA